MDCNFSLIEGTEADYACTLCGLIVRNVYVLPIKAECKAAPVEAKPLVKIKDCGCGGKLSAVRRMNEQRLEIEAARRKARRNMGTK